jgi:hypothetical protein
VAKIDNFEAGASGLATEGGVNAGRVVIVSRGKGFSVSGTTGTVAATLAPNSSLFTMRLDPGAGGIKAFIERVRVEFTTLTAFSVPVTAGRRIGLFRASGATPSGGTAIVDAVPKHSTNDGSEFSAGNGGDIRFATTALLTVTGITFEPVALRELSLAHVGAAGGFRDAVWEFNAAESMPIQLDAGQLIALRNIPAMDAAGTFQLSVSVDWVEAPVMDWAA